MSQPCVAARVEGEPNIVELHDIRESWPNKKYHVGSPRTQRKYPFSVDDNKVSMPWKFPLAHCCSGKS